jgi:hypothetical protein
MGRGNLLVGALLGAFILIHVWEPPVIWWLHW